MEKEMVSSTISNPGRNIIAVVVGSNSSNNPCHPNKRPRDDDNSVAFPRYKGVVLQQNGHWGAQIYANHQRIWLGTFRTEAAAAIAYDSASIKLRRGDSHRNFPWTDLNILHEPDFQDLHTTEDVLNMIKDGSYQSKLTEFIVSRSPFIVREVREQVINKQEVLCEHLFRKELTPSDVGKLNRLVIPKKHALTYLPQVSEVSSKGNEDGGRVESVELPFFDRQLKSWKFRYCYWKSSQSFVFTKGWNQFVKEKELKVSDTITIYRYENKPELKNDPTFYLIDIHYNIGKRNDNFDRGKLELQPGLRGNFEFGSDGEDKKREEEKKKKKKKKSVRLFGVQIG